MKKIAYLLFITFSFSCISETKVPDNIIPIEKMAKAVSKLMIAEDITYQKGLQTDSSKKLFLGNYKPILLDSLNITVADFDSSIKFYLKNPALFKEVMILTEVELAPDTTKPK